jgi:D-alanine-D-alanine ligase
MSAPRILILYNEPTLPADHPDADSEHDVLETADIIARHLQAGGFAVSRLGVTTNAKAIMDGLLAAKPDAVFNLYEGTAGWGNSEEYVAGVLELLRIPYTGCPTLPMTLCRNKPLAKQLFAGAGIPTAPFFVVEDGPCPPCPLPWPVIVKPGKEDASVGIDQSSVCQTQAELETRVEYIRTTYGPSVLVEQLIVGREFHVPVIERDGQRIVLPFSEILFPPPPAGSSIWPIVTFDAKWKPQSRDFAATPAKNPAEVDDHLRESVSRIVLKTFDLLGCRDYARVDLRIDHSDQPFVLEMNPNPCINPLAGVAAALESAKIPYEDFLYGLVRAALRRGDAKNLADWNPTRPTIQQTLLSDSAWTIRPLERGEPLPDGSRLTENNAISAAERIIIDQRLADALQSGIAFAATDGGTIIGIASSRLSDATNRVYSLDFLATIPEYRRKGVGGALLRAIEKRIATDGGRLLLADIPSSPGFASIRQFLSANRYLASGEIPDYYTDGYSRFTFSKSFPAVTSTTGPGLSHAVRMPGIGGGLL